MAVANLTKRTVDAAEPRATRYVIFDAKLNGFGLRVSPSGAKRWIVEYRPGEGGRAVAKRRLTIGAAGAITPDQARSKAERILAQARLGADPNADRAEARASAARTLKLMIDVYLEKAKERLRPRSYEEVERHLLKHWAPLHTAALEGITQAHIANRLDEIAKSNGRVAAARSRSSISALFTFAARRGRVATNPVTLTERPISETDIERDRVLSDDELVSIWRACEHDEYGNIVRLLLLLAQRRDEVGGMAWSEVDTAAAAWTIPKARAKNGKEHAVPLPGPALDILATVPRREKRDLVFGRGEGSFSGWSRAKAALDGRIATARAKDGKSAMAPWRLHDLRRTAATKLDEELGVLPFVVEALLNHSLPGERKNRVAKTYNRSTYSLEKRQALDLWAAHVLALVEGEPLNVVSLRHASARHSQA